uniref:Uncharacterized protein n=1 Tax=Lepeophtheirus salmonis TaxID=72036 RepID=A0A0K2TGK5_LEPSM
MFGFCFVLICSSYQYCPTKSFLARFNPDGAFLCRVVYKLIHISKNTHDMIQ